MRAALKGGGVVESTRQKRVTLKPLASSSTMRAVIATGSVDLGASGECDPLRMSGATLFVSVELARPGVPPAGRLEAQFWPALLPRVGLRNSIDLPSPSAGEYHVQPR